MENEKKIPKILVVTEHPWNESNSIGNTLSNLFSNYDISKIAHLYFLSSKPKNSICNKYFSLNIFKIMRKRIKIRNNFINENNNINLKIENKLTIFFREKFTTLGRFVQELFWLVFFHGDEDLTIFVKNFKPDIIFLTSVYSIYPYRITLKLLKLTNSNLVLFLMDDYLDFNPKNIFKAIYQKILKKNLLKITNNSKLIYTISNKMRLEYKKKYGFDSKILYKGNDFSDVNKEKYYPTNSDFIKIVYTGNLTFGGRWKSLKLLRDVLYENNLKYSVEIYSQIEIPKKVFKDVFDNKKIVFKGNLPYHKLKELYKNADILLFLESIEENDTYLSRLSFSTKIVDYLFANRCILAISSKKVASTQYLIENDAAIVTDNKKELSEILLKIQEKREILSEYAEKAWNCGVRNHQRDKIQNDLKNKFIELLKNG